MKPILLAALPILSLLPLTRPSTTDAAEVGPPAAHLRGDAPEDCGKCHRDQLEEWRTTLHAMAWKDEVYQAAIKTRRRPQSCHSCHVPATVIDRVPDKPLAREDGLEHGIDCRSCHVLDGKVHGPFGAETDAHESVKSPLYGGKDVGLCLSCHDRNVGPVRALGESFERGKARKEGKTCMHCHMPEVERVVAVDPDTGKATGAKRKGRKHTLNGPSDKAFLAKAFEFEVAEADGKTVLKLWNRAGHRIPALIQRTFSVEFSSEDAKGGKLWSKSQEVLGGRDGFLDVDAAVEMPAEAPKGHARWTVKVMHFFGERDAQEFRGKVFEASR
ncbi:MAG: multiheme c-type cytochrome [Planctomycetota bacterium]